MLGAFLLKCSRFNMFNDFSKFNSSSEFKATDQGIMTFLTAILYGQPPYLNTTWTQAICALTTLHLSVASHHFPTFFHPTLFWANRESQKTPSSPHYHERRKWWEVMATNWSHSAGIGCWSMVLPLVLCNFWLQLSSLTAQKSAASYRLPFTPASQLTLFTDCIEASCILQTAVRSSITIHHWSSTDIWLFSWVFSWP